MTTRPEACNVCSCRETSSLFQSLHKCQTLKMRTRIHTALKRGEVRRKSLRRRYKDVGHGRRLQKVKAKYLGILRTASWTSEKVRLRELSAKCSFALIGRPRLPSYPPTTPPSSSPKSFPRSVLIILFIGVETSLNHRHYGQNQGGRTAPVRS